MCLEKFKKKGECFVQSSLRETPLSPHVPQNKAHSILYIYVVRFPFYLSLFFRIHALHICVNWEKEICIYNTQDFLFCYVNSPLILCNSFFYNLCNLFNNYKLWFYFLAYYLPLNLRSFLSIFQGETLDFNICPVIDFLPP